MKISSAYKRAIIIRWLSSVEFRIFILWHADLLIFSLQRMVRKIFMIVFIKLAWKPAGGPTGCPSYGLEVILSWNNCFTKIHPITIKAYKRAIMLRWLSSVRWNDFSSLMMKPQKQIFTYWLLVTKCLCFKIMKNCWLFDIKFVFIVNWVKVFSWDVLMKRRIVL